MKASILVCACLSGAAALQHSAMWGLSSYEDGAGWATMTFSTGNLTQIEENFDQAGMVALLPISWTASRPEKCYAPIPHTQTTPDGTFGCLQIDPAYKTKWQAVWQDADTQRLIKKGAIVGVFLGDEHMWFGIQLSELKAIADEVRLSWPSAIVYSNEAPDIAMCNYRKDNTTVFAQDECLPVNVDWFGFDFYQHDATSWEAARYAYESFVFPRFGRADQRAAPVSLGYSDGDLSVAAAADLDAFCAQNAREFFAMGLGDARFVGQFPFHYNGGVRNANGSITGGAGIIDLPNCLKTYQGIGQVIAAAGPAGTSLDPPLSPPAPAGGKFVEPKCATRLPPSPGTWPWCDRTNKPKSSFTASALKSSGLVRLPLRRRA